MHSAVYPEPVNIAYIFNLYRLNIECLYFCPRYENSYVAQKSPSQNYQNNLFYNLYTNTVLDGSVILSVCSFAIETTFPLSNFKTKHTFGILMTLRKFLKLWGTEGVAPPEVDGNPAEGGCFASPIIIQLIDVRKFHYVIEI